MDKMEFQKNFTELTNIPQNRFHPLVWLAGDPEIGENVYIGGMSEVYAKGAHVMIGDNCDIASFVSINCSDSHKRCIGILDNAERKDIIIENNVYIGTQSFIGGGVHIGHHSVVGAGTVVRSGKYPPYSLIVGNPAVVKAGYYKKRDS
jgi:acetyltransferase-like isoleucine patch superfamily enzyme